MKAIAILALVASVILVSCEQYEYQTCLGVDEPIPNNPKIIKEKKNSNKFKTSVTAYYDPLILPFKIKWNSDKGLFAEYSNGCSALTYIGVVGINYNVSTLIDGVEVKSSDYLVVLTNHKKDTKQVFKITGYDNLKVKLSGKTAIEANSGIVDIDVTDARIDELKFYDGNKAAVTNTTDMSVSFKFSATVNGIESIYNCQIPPKSYRKIPIENLASYFVQLENSSVQDDNYHSIKQEILKGENMLIVIDGEKLTFKKVKS